MGRDVTRRLLLRVLMGGVLTAAFLLVPLPLTGDPVVESEAIVLDEGVATAGFDEVVDVDNDAELVGFTWEGIEDATLEVRAAVGSGWTEWLRLEGSLDEGPDADSVEASTRVSAGPAWLGRDVGRIQVRVIEGSAPQLTAHAINSESPRPDSVSVAVAGAETPLPGIIPRARWQANESWRSLNCSGDPSYAPNVRFAVVHHTVSTNSYGPGDSAALIRGIYQFHTHTNGWCDIGYNFLIDRHGQVFEGRFGGINRAVIGGHASGLNTGSTGIALIGDFTAEPVPNAAATALRRTLAWKLAYHGVNPTGTVTVTVGPNTSSRWPAGTVVDIPTVVGHRDTNTTGCPGERLYQLLPSLRAQVGADIATQGRGHWTCQWDHHASFGPAAIAPMPGRLDVFVRGDDGQLWQSVDLGGGAGPWSPLGGALTSDPDATSWGQGRLDVVARGTDSALWHRFWGGSGWSPWTSLGGALAASPSIVSWGSGRLDVFACGVDGQLWQRTMSSGAWGPWSALGGLLQSAPDATSRGSGQIDVFGRGVDGRIWYRSFADGTWSGWRTNDGGFTAGPGAVGAITANGSELHVGGRGLDNRVYVNSYDVAWSGWRSLGGLVTSDVDLASVGPGRVDLIGRGIDGNYWRQSRIAGQWSGWVRFR